MPSPTREGKILVPVPSRQGKVASRITTPAQAGGRECFFRHGAAMPCVQGMGTCNANGRSAVDCAGTWDPPICEEDCGVRTWTVTTEPRGGGELCEHETGYQALCQQEVVVHRRR